MASSRKFTINTGSSSGLGQSVLRAGGLPSRITVQSEPMTVMEGYIGFAKGWHEDVERKINPVIRKTRKSGVIDRIISAELLALNDFQSGSESTPCQSASD